MLPSEASHQYRADVAAATARYRAQLRYIFGQHGNPIPLTKAAEHDMTVAWWQWRIATHMAGVQLQIRRGF